MTSMTPLTIEQVEHIIKDRMGIDVKMYQVPGELYGNMAEYQSDLLNTYPYLYEARYYAVTRFEEVNVYLVFKNEIFSDFYGGYYDDTHSHRVVILKGEKVNE
jgi:hypothetical protein